MLVGTIWIYCNSSTLDISNGRYRKGFNKYIYNNPTPLSNFLMLFLINKLRYFAQSIRKKYLRLKLGKSEENETLNKLFKPVI